MEKKNINVSFRKTAGSSDPNSYSCRVTLPRNWLDQMGVTPEHREVTLSFCQNRITLEPAGRQTVKPVPLASKKEIRCFALVWAEMFKNHENIPYEFFTGHEFLGEGLASLGFEMDCGHAVEEAFPCEQVLNDNEALRRRLDKFDIKLLGSAVFSQWRYWNHWADVPISKEGYEWFVIAFSGLAELCGESDKD